MEYRVNGKHTSSIFSEMNGDMPDAVVLIESYECETLEDVANLYSTFDRSRSGRSSNDINRVFQASNDQLSLLPKKLVDVCVTGLSYSTWENASSHHMPEERSELMIKHINFVLFMHQLVGSREKDSQFLLRGGVVAAIFRCWTKSQSGALEFWGKVRDGISDNPSSPSGRIHKFLLSAIVRSGGGMQITSKNKADSREFMCRCIVAWNAWRDNRDMEIIKYYPTAKIPSAK